MKWNKVKQSSKLASKQTSKQNKAKRASKQSKAKRASKAKQSEQARNLIKELSEANSANQVSEAKQIKPGQRKQVSMQTSKQSKANRASHLASHAYNKLRLPSHTGRDEEDDEEGAKMSFKISENQIYISLGSKYIYKMKKYMHVKFLCV